jgi:hypothetical protein
MSQVQSLSVAPNNKFLPHLNLPEEFTVAEVYKRDLRDYLIEIDDRVEFVVDGETMRGNVCGRGSAGHYIKVEGDDGQVYSMYSNEEGFRKLFPGD